MSIQMSGNGSNLAEWFREYKKELHADPYPLYRELVREQPISFIADRNMWVVSRYDDVNHVLKSPKFVREYNRVVPPDPSASPSPEARTIGRMTGNWMLFRDPPSHTRLRGLVNHAFTPRMMERLKPSIRQIAGRLAEDLKRGESPCPDLISDFAFPLPVIVIADLLGVPVEDHDQFKEWSNTMAKLLDIALATPEFMKQAADTVEEMTQYFRLLIEQRKKQPQEDLITGLLSVQEEGDKLNEDELIATCVLLLVAGHETTVNLIGNGMLTLFTHPEQLTRLREEPGLSASAVEEMLRFESPVQMTSRIVAEDLQLSGHEMRRGQEVIVILAAANRDPGHFVEPDRFDIVRTPNRHLAFAAGIHFCLGAPLARMEAEIAISSLLQAFPGIRMAVDVPEWRPNILFRGLRSLPVEL